jgi:hypothetical protein
MCSLTAPGARASLAVASPEPPGSTPDLERNTNMLAFLRFAACDFQGAKPRV